MTYVVYLLVTKTKYKWISYVGYTNNIKNRLLAHNNSKGAKFTRGRKWEIIYQKRYKNKSTAMKEEYKLKKDKKKRNILKSNYIKKNENINFTAL
jgi:putative endonuclease